MPLCLQTAAQRRVRFAVCALLVCWALPLAAAEQPLVSAADRLAVGKEGLPPQVSIPFAHHSIDSWQPNGRKGLWIRAQRKWYYAELLMDCQDLPFTEQIGFGSNGTDTFDRFAWILVAGQRYPLRSLTAGAPPPRAHDKHSRPRKVPPSSPPAKPPG